MENVILLESTNCYIDFWGWVYPRKKDGSMDYENRIHARNCSQDWLENLPTGEKFAVSCFINNLDEQEIVNKKLNSLL